MSSSHKISMLLKLGKVVERLEASGNNNQLPVRLPFKVGDNKSKSTRATRYQDMSWLYAQNQKSTKKEGQHAGLIVLDGQLIAVTNRIFHSARGDAR